MNFTSFHFVIFFFVTLILGHVLKNRTQRVFLWIASASAACVDTLGDADQNPPPSPDGHGIHGVPLEPSA